MFFNAKSLMSASLLAMGLLASNPVLGELREVPLQDPEEIKRILAEASRKHDINIAPLIGVDTANALREHDREAAMNGEYAQRYENRLNFEIDNNLRRGFNLIVVTCPSEEPALFAQQGINLQSIDSPEHLRGHLTADNRTNPVVTDGAAVKREFTFVATSGNKLTLLTNDNFDDLAKPFSTTTPLFFITAERVEMMVKAYKDKCFPKF